MKKKFHYRERKKTESVSLIGDYHSGTTRSRAMSLHQTGVYVGMIGGGGLAAFWGRRLLHPAMRNDFTSCRRTPREALAPILEEA